MADRLDFSLSHANPSLGTFDRNEDFAIGEIEIAGYRSIIF